MADTHQLCDLPLLRDCSAGDLAELANRLTPFRVSAGTELIQQGDTADFFVIVADGSVTIRHEGDAGTVDTTLASPQILGELALLRHARRVATVTATSEVTGWRGGDAAFEELIVLPGVLEVVVATARQRMAAFLTPIPVTMRDGTELLLRPALPGDVERTLHGHVEFSRETIYRRFMSARVPNQKLMEYLFEVDYVDHFVWVVTDTDGDVVADGRFVRYPDDPSSAEIAFTVGDDYQGKGVGSFLMKAVTIAAGVDGVEKFTARVLSDNLSMRTILDRYQVEWETVDIGVVNTVFDVPSRRQIQLPTPLLSAIKTMSEQVIHAVG